MLKIAPPTPRMPPSRLVMLAVSETKRFTSVVITDATSNSSSMVRKASEARKSETTVGKIWTNSVVCSTITGTRRSEEHTSELQSRFDLVCRLLLETKNKIDKHEER